MKNRKLKKEYLIICKISEVGVYKYNMEAYRQRKDMLQIYPENLAKKNKIITKKLVSNKILPVKSFHNKSMLLTCPNKDEFFYDLIRAEREGKVCVFVASHSKGTNGKEEGGYRYVFNIKEMYTFKDMDELQKLEETGWIETLKEKSIERSKKYYEDANYRCDYHEGEKIFYGMCSSTDSRPAWDTPGSGYLNRNSNNSGSWGME
jgi:hypothetical protein